MNITNRIVTCIFSLLCKFPCSESSLKQKFDFLSTTKLFLLTCISYWSRMQSSYADSARRNRGDLLEQVVSCTQSTLNQSPPDFTQSQNESDSRISLEYDSSVVSQRQKGSKKLSPEALENMLKVFSEDKSEEEKLSSILAAYESESFLTPRPIKKRKVKRNLSDAVRWTKVLDPDVYEIMMESDFEKAYIDRTAKLHYETVYKNLKQMLEEEVTHSHSLDNKKIGALIFESFLGHSIELLYKNWKAAFAIAPKPASRKEQLTLVGFKCMVGLNFALAAFDLPLERGIHYICHDLKMNYGSATGIPSFLTVENFRHWKRFLTPYSSNSNLAVKKASDKLVLTRQLQVRKKFHQFLVSKP